VVATGNPAFDALTSPDDPVLRTRLREQAGIGQDDWTVLWAEQPEPADPQLPLRMREHLARVCRVNGWRLLVRLHPSSQASAPEAMPPDALTSPRSEHVRDALLKSDAVVTFTSTIGFEALVLDKPVVVAALSQYSAFVDYRETDGVLVVDSLDAVEPALVSLFRGDETAQILAAHRRAMPRNGRAAQAIVQCLLSQQAPAPMEQFPA
jgi:CDP-glycerol glycerophosphotransferase (TagB/SpsB family)